MIGVCAILSRMSEITPFVLFIGEINHEGIVSAIKAEGLRYEKKLLESRPENWEKIVDFLGNSKLRAVLLKLNWRAYYLLDQPKYSHVRAALFSELRRHKYMCFVYEETLSALPEEDPEQSHEFAEYGEQMGLENEVVIRGNDFLRSNGIVLTPYRTNAEVTVICTQFLTSTFSNLLFRIYVPKGRLWAAELERLLQLFRDFLRNAGRKQVRMEQTHSNDGAVYEFHDPTAETDLAAEFERFTQFMDLCLTDRRGAASLLSATALNQQEVEEVITRYAKEARRLQLDLKHDRERKLLSIRHRLESELADILRDGEIEMICGQVLQEAIPLAHGTSDILAVSANAPARNITVNLAPTITYAVNSIIESEVQGTAHLSPAAKQMLAAIEKLGGHEKTELSTSVHEINDEGTPQPQKIKAAQRLKAFLVAFGPKLGNAAADVLLKYVEKKLIG